MNIFIIHSSEQEELFDSLKTRLIVAGHSVFDPGRLDKGQGYDDRIRSEIWAADLVIFLVSASSIVRTSYAMTELTWTEDRWPNPNGRVLPVIVDATRAAAVPPYLRAVAVLTRNGNQEASVVAEVEKMQGASRLGKTVRFGFPLILILSAILAGLLWIRGRQPDVSDEQKKGGPRGRSEVTLSLGAGKPSGTAADGRPQWVFTLEITNTGNQTISSGPDGFLTVRVCADSLRRSTELPPSVRLQGVSPGTPNTSVYSKLDNLLQLRLQDFRPGEIRHVDVPLSSSIVDLGGVFLAEGHPDLRFKSPPTNWRQLCAN